MLTAKRTSIRRRLAIRRAANGPPWRRRKSGHAHIVAPLFAGVAVTAATTAAVRAGVAVAVAERARRAARAQREGERRFALRADETPDQGLRRMALAQLDLAVEMLAMENGAVSPSEAIHEVRKALKRLRALLSLVSDQLGEEAVTRDRAVLRRVARRLAGSRDAGGMVGTPDGPVGPPPEAAPRPPPGRPRPHVAPPRPGPPPAPRRGPPAQAGRARARPRGPAGGRIGPRAHAVAQRPAPPAREGRAMAPAAGARHRASGAGGAPRLSARNATLRARTS